MGKPLLLVGSVTYAGCGYGVYVPQGADEAETVLRENNIKLLGRVEEESS